MSLIPKLYPVFSPGETVSIPFAVVNNTTEKVTGVTLAFDAVPSEVSYTRNFKDTGSFNEMTGVWEIPALNPGQAEIIWMEFSTFNLGKDPITITGNIINAENADYPGEAETAVGATIYLHPSGDSFQGFATKELLNISTGASGDYEIQSESGVTYVFDMPTDDVDIQLPIAGPLDDGFFIAIKVVNGNSKNINVYPESGGYLDGIQDDYDTLGSHGYMKYTLVKSLTPVTWIKTSYS